MFQDHDFVSSVDRGFGLASFRIFGFVLVHLETELYAREPDFLLNFMLITYSHVCLGII